MTEYYSIEKFDKGKVIHFEGNFTGGPETDELVKILESSAAEKPNNVVLDFKDVDYASSIVIGILVKMHKEFTDNDGNLVFANLNETLKNVFKITNVASFLNIADTVENAKKMIR